MKKIKTEMELISGTIDKMVTDEPLREAVLANLRSLDLFLAEFCYQKRFDHLEVGKAIKVCYVDEGVDIVGFSDYRINAYVRRSLYVVCPNFDQLGYTDLVGIVPAAIAEIERRKEKLAS